LLQPPLLSGDCVKLVLVKEAVRSGLFESEASIRAMIARGDLLRGIHWFQEKPRGRIRLDLDAIVEKFTRPKVEAPPERIRLIRSTLGASAKEIGIHGLPRS
jgi:hypothetical protein